MSDRVPIGTIPGITSQLVDTDILIATLGVACTVTRVMLRQTDYDDSGATDTSLTATVRNAMAGGGEGISVVIADQTQAKVQAASSPLVVDADESIYLRVSDGSSVAMNLTGWIEVSGAAGVTTALTNLARVKEFLNISDSASDDKLNTLIAAVSDEIQGELDRKIVQATATGERVDSNGSEVISVDEYPIISVSSLEENSVALVEDTDFEMKAQDLEAGEIVRISGSLPIAWISGSRVIKITYSHGYATIPEAIKQAATELVAFDYLQEKSSGARFGLGDKVSDVGGSSTYSTREDVWKSQRSRLSQYHRMWF